MTESSGVSPVLTRLQSPGTVWLQSLSFARVASRVFAAVPVSKAGRGKQGGILGNILNGRD